MPRRTPFHQPGSSPPSPGFFERHPEKIADAIIIATIENVRADPIRLGMQAGYAVLCEKPLGLTASDAARAQKGLFMVCHQMRYTPRHRTLNRVVASGDYGSVINIEHSENLDFEHRAQSYVRGFFNNDALTPMILAKSCHDMDLLLYVITTKPLRISSFGGSHISSRRTHPRERRITALRAARLPTNAPKNARRIYFWADSDPNDLRQMGAIQDRAHLMELLKTNRFGRCV